jgi:tetratricopeptide (TPR) repeat protein
LIASGLCALAIATPVAAAQQMTATEHYSTLQQASDAFSQRKFAEAATLYRKLVGNNQRSGDLWLRLAQSYNQSGNLTEATQAFQKAFRLGSRQMARSDVAYRLAQSYARAGNKAMSLDWLDTALAERFPSRGQLQTDTVFTAYREDERFRRLAGMLPRGKLTRDDGMRFDVAFLSEEAKRLNPSNRRPAYTASFDAAVKQLQADIPRLTDLQVSVRMFGLLAMLDDGHVWVAPPKAESGGGFSVSFPVDFYAFSDGLFVIGGGSEIASSIGARVISIGNKTADELLKALVDIAPHDNEMSALWKGMFLLPVPEVLQLLGATNSLTEVTLSLADTSGRRKNVTLHAGSGYARAYNLPRVKGVGTEPFYMQDVLSNLFKPLPEANAFYFLFNAVFPKQEATPGSGPQAPFATLMSQMTAMSKELEQGLRESGARNLIIDVRNNFGGNSYLLGPILRAIAQFQEAAPDHRIFVIIGRGTFSAAQNFLTQVERLADVTFVGEPSGSRPNFTGESRPFKLPYSGIGVNISFLEHAGPYSGDQRQWIAPDVPAALSSQDYFANRDPALEAILAIIKLPSK